MKRKMEKPEKRIYSSTIEIEKREDGEAKSIIGHAAVFDLLSENLGGFREKIDKGAFDDVLNDDVRALVNHEDSLILARSPKTLSLSVDDKGLVYKISPVGKRSYEKDLIESLERGDVSQSSFQFSVEDDSWDEDEEGRVVRTIKKFKRLYDVSPVTFPAYPDTDSAARQFRNYLKGKGIDIPEDRNISEFIKELKDLEEYTLPDGNIIQWRRKSDFAGDIVISYKQKENVELGLKRQWLRILELN
jgi:hypothetical protein